MPDAINSQLFMIEHLTIPFEGAEVAERNCSIPHGTPPPREKESSLSRTAPGERVVIL
jgi:hypothetical protein